MILRGILDRSLSNQICIRGFARIKELARISQANNDYQRELIDKQIKLTSNFLIEEKYLFFPEVILSLKLKQDLTLTGANKEYTPIQLLEKRKIFKSNLNTLSIKPIIKRNNKVFDVTETDAIVISEISFDDIELDELIKKNEHPFHRIDGNHRLSAAEQIEGDDRIKVMNIPFCIVLFEEIIKEEFNPEKGSLEKIKDNSYEKFERVVFYNINSKSIPLTIDENLRGILGEEKLFSNKDVEEIFNEKGIASRNLGKRIKIEDFSSINNILKDNKWAMCLNIISLHKDGIDVPNFESNEELVNAIYDAIQEINLMYRWNKDLKANPSIEILTSFIYFRVFAENSKFDFFTKWLLNNHLFEAEETTAISIIRIFDKIYQRKKFSVFVAMPYWSEKKVNDYNKLFKEILKEIQSNAKSNLELELIPIMRFKGESERIDQRLLSQIRDCDIFIADITECNTNVMYEVAFAEGCLQPMILLKKENDPAQPPFDMDKLQWIPYDGDTYYNSIKSIIKNNLPVILQGKFGMNF